MEYHYCPAEEGYRAFEGECFFCGKKEGGPPSETAKYHENLDDPA
jgi:hypothetical protein